MKFAYLLLIFISLGNASESLDNHVCQSECPPWSVTVNNNETINCKCNSTHGRVVCDENSDTSKIFFAYCMTYDEVNNSIAIGMCPYHYHKPDAKGLYVKLPQNVCDVNEFMCGGLNRTGLLCSNCKAGMGPAVFSYTLPCLKCLDGGYGWLLYMFLATFPTTVMFLVVIICQIRITAAPMNALVFACQVLVSMVNVNPHYYTDDIPKPSYYLTKFFLSVYGVFNLDFFRYIIPHFCVSSTMTATQALSLEYIVAFYPLFLITVFYICIQLHARGCKPLVYLWRPFHKCCACISQNWSPSESLIHSFAAFLLLSYSKILCVSFTLLHNSSISTQDNSGERGGSLVSYYDANVPYFSTQHRPFLILAISIFAIFIVLPVLILLLYPTRVFQRCIGCCSTRWHALRAFVDAFQGHYKDGTNGTPDWRYFSGLYLVFRILAIATHTVPTTLYSVAYRVTCYSSASLFFGLLQPYKEKWINYIDSIGFMLFSVGEFLAVYDEKGTRTFFLIDVLAVVPLVYIIVYTSYKLLFQTAVLRCCVPRCKKQIDELHSDFDVDVEREAYIKREEREPLLTTASDLGGRYSRDEETLLPVVGNDLW